jgi:N-acyl homoserine lactone hydrolase
MRLQLFAVGTLRRTSAPVVVYLIRTDDGTNVLVDTGYPRDRAGAWRSDPSEMIQLEPRQDIVHQLRNAGLEPDDISIVVCSHLDPDHSGNHDAFPSAEFVVQRSHHDLARSGAVARIERCRSRWDRPELRYRLIDGDCELLPGVELIESSGHVLGHQSVLVRLPDTGSVLLAVDAIPDAAACDPGTRPIYPFDLDEDATRGSTAKLMRIARERRAHVLHGHDAVQWGRLRAAAGPSRPPAPVLI